jgi:hypothetical protein
VQILLFLFAHCVISWSKNLKYKTDCATFEMRNVPQVYAMRYIDGLWIDRWCWPAGGWDVLLLLLLLLLTSLQQPAAIILVCEPASSGPQGSGMRAERTQAGAMLLMWVSECEATRERERERKKVPPFRCKRKRERHTLAYTIHMLLLACLHSTHCLFAAETHTN